MKQGVHSNTGVGRWRHMNVLVRAQEYTWDQRQLFKLHSWSLVNYPWAQPLSMAQVDKHFMNVKLSVKCCISPKTKRN